MPKSVLRTVFGKMQFTLHATCRTPHGDSRLVQATSAWLVNTRRAPSRHSREARDYGHTTTAMHKLSTPPPPPTPYLPSPPAFAIFVLMCFNLVCVRVLGCCTWPCLRTARQSLRALATKLSDSGTRFPAPKAGKVRARRACSSQRARVFDDRLKVVDVRWPFEGRGRLCCRSFR